MEVGLSLGSNLPDRLAHLRAAESSLLALPGARLLARARVYETEPVDVLPEFAHLAFLNTVLVVAWEGALRALFDGCRRIEAAQGRSAARPKNAPRAIDIDILYADELVLREPDLSVPHPRWSERLFVLRPLADVRPARVLPGQSRSVANLLADFAPGPRVTRIEDN